MPLVPNLSASSPARGFTPVNRALTKPDYLKCPDANPLHGAEMLPDLHLDTTLDPAAILARQPLPEVSPIFVGFRRRLAERSIPRVQTKIEQRTREAAVIGYVGRSIIDGIRGDNYTLPDRPFRPTTRRELKTTARLVEITAERHQRQRLASNIATPYIVEMEGSDHGEPVLTPSFRQTGLRVSKPERKNNARNRRENRRHRGAAEYQDALFSAEATRPYHEAQELIEERDELVLKAVALRRQQEANARAKRALVVTAGAMAYEGWSNTKLDAQMAAQKAKRITAPLVHKARDGTRAAVRTGALTTKRFTGNVASKTKGKASKVAKKLRRK